MENNGYVMSGLSLLLIIPTILLLIVLTDMYTHLEYSNIDVESDNAYYILGDVEQNIPDISKRVLTDTAEEVILNGNPCSNSRRVIREHIQSKIDNLTCDILKSTGVDVKCDINSVNSSQNPFCVEINSTIWIQKDNIVYNRTINQKISISNTNSQPIAEKDRMIPDPLPFIKCKKYGGAKIKNGRISYGSSLSNYLNSWGINNSQVYENASSPLYITKCPYEPYTLHGNCEELLNLKNCIDNGYYHESSDGACFLCRLEGKGTCNHYGLETFIVPTIFDNTTLISAPCSSDHVIFNDSNVNGTYDGELVKYYTSSDEFFCIYLDYGHRSKYGLI